MPDEDHIRVLAERLVDDSGVSVPTNVGMLASLRGIVGIEQADLPVAGMLSPEDGHLIVRVRSSDSNGRQRFSALHETVHTFCPGFGETQFRCNPNSSQNHVEHLCDYGASELLLPRRYFAPDLAEAGFEMGAVAELADRYQASVECTAIRAVDLWRDRNPAAVLVFKVQLKPSERDQEGAAPRLRLAWAHRTGAWPFLPAYKSVSNDSPFARALDGELVETTEPLSDLVADAEDRYVISARAVGNERVVALVRRLPIAAAAA
jgi:uncharacterized protein DUF955